MAPFQLGYDLFWIGLKEKRQHGIWIAMHNSSYIVIENTLHQSERLMAEDIVVHDCKKKKSDISLCSN